MERTSIMAEPKLLDRLRRVATERNVSLAALIREALEEKVATVQPTPRSGGVALSGHRDTARRAGEQRPRPRPWR